MAYTARGIMEAVLTELNKVNAPSVLLDDFNYFFNKAILQFVNKQYNIYDVNLLTTDNMRVLKAGALLKPHKAYLYADFANGISGVVGDDVKMIDSLYGATYEVDLPDDYFHLLNCICIYKLKKRDGCHNAGDYWSVAAQRLTADLWAGVLNNLYARPLPRRPYYYIHNVNTSVERPTNPITLDSNGLIIRGTDVTPTTTYVFELDKYSIVADSNGDTLQVVVTSTKKLNDEDPVFLDFNIVIKEPNTVGVLVQKESDGTVQISIPLNTSTDQHFVLVDFILNESNKTITLTIILSANRQSRDFGYVYYGTNNSQFVPTSVSEIENSPNKIRIDSEPATFTINVKKLRVNTVWFAIPSGFDVQSLGLNEYNIVDDLGNTWNGMTRTTIPNTNTEYIIYAKVMNNGFINNLFKATIYEQSQ